MIKRFLIDKDAIRSIISTPERVAGLDAKQRAQLKKIVISHDDWEVIQSLALVMEPFVLATQIISARLYPTIGTGFFVYRTLEHFLEAKESDSSLTSLMKKSLRHHFNTYFRVNVSESQQKYMLVRHL
jgi:hypothetical protein